MFTSKLGVLLSLSLWSIATTTGLQEYKHVARQEPPKGLITTNTTTTLTPQFFTDLGSKRVKVRYGPVVVPPMTSANGMKDYWGLPNNTEIGCKNCTITFMQAGLEYPNGTYANANTSLWLHHILFYNINQTDTVCGIDEGGERFFASGNERSPVNLCINGTEKAGYYVGANDSFVLLTELMNEAREAQSAVVTVTYEYLPGLPVGFHKVTPIWLDITGCGSSEEPAKINTAFQYTSPVWTANATGRVTAAIGHLHDGGVHLDIFKENTSFCDSVASYGQNPGYIDPAGSSMNMNMTAGMDMANMGMHISSLSGCSTGQVNLGDNMTITAYYNTTEYMPMTNTDGSLAPIMGIALMYLAQNETYTSTTSAPTSSPTASGSAGVSSSSSTAAAPMITGGPFLMAGAMGAMVALGFA